MPEYPEVAPIRTRPRRSAVAAAGAALALAIPLALFSQPAAAQNASLGFNVWKTKIDCGRCHGWAGNGAPDDPRSAKGANLRETQLTRDQIIEVIKCGRPGTGMPHYDARAYEDDRCYGSTRADLGDQTPPNSAVSLIPREINAVADYLQEKVIGRGPITREECVEYFASDSSCGEYPPAGG